MSTHSEPGTIPNGSKPSTGRRGRPAVMDDDALDSHILNLVQQTGELPTLDVIVRSAGGSQRSRAVSARQRIAAKLARNDIDTQLQLLPDIEARHRVLMRQWLEAAQAMMEPVLHSRVTQINALASEAEQALHDARHRLEAAEQDNQALRMRADSLADEVAALSARVTQLVTSEAKYRALASKRKAMLDRLTAK